MSATYLSDVSLSYRTGGRELAVLSSVSVTFVESGIHLVKGPSGSGKSTLLAVLGGLLTPDRGRVTALGTSLDELNSERRANFRLAQLGFVFQDFALFRSLTALENVIVALELRGIRGEAAREAATAALARVGLGARADALIPQLSGGEKQRVAIARTLVTSPGLILADEPTAALDRRSADEVIALLADEADRNGRLVVLVSHDDRLRTSARAVTTLLDGRIVEDERL